MGKPGGRRRRRRPLQPAGGEALRLKRRNLPAPARLEHSQLNEALRFIRLEEKRFRLGKRFGLGPFKIGAAFRTGGLSKGKRFVCCCLLLPRAGAGNASFRRKHFVSGDRVLTKRFGCSSPLGGKRFDPGSAGGFTKGSASDWGLSKSGRYFGPGRSKGKHFSI